MVWKNVVITHEICGYGKKIRTWFCTVLVYTIKWERRHNVPLIPIQEPRNLHQSFYNMKSLSLDQKRTPCGQKSTVLKLDKVRPSLPPWGGATKTCSLFNPHRFLVRPIPSENCTATDLNRSVRWCDGLWTAYSQFKKRLARREVHIDSLGLFGSCDTYSWGHAVL